MSMRRWTDDDYDYQWDGDVPDDDDWDEMTDLDERVLAGQYDEEEM